MRQGPVHGGAEAAAQSRPPAPREGKPYNGDEVMTMLVCTFCKKEWGEERRPWRCSCGAPLAVRGGVVPFGREMIQSGEQGMWRYRAALPAGEACKAVSMGEGWTPLVREPWPGLNLFFKLDYVCPTGSYKDRGMAYLVSRLVGLGIREVVEDSSGNAGASMAAYCARAGIKCRVFVPEYTSAGKCVQIESYGGILERVPGSREETMRAAERSAETSYYASHNWSPYFTHGVKTFALEIWEQLGFRAPDVLLLPAGQGSLVLGCALAFEALRAAGEIAALPRIYALQPEGCAPLHLAYVRGMDVPDRIEKRETIAEGISSAEPVRGREVLKAVRESGGEVLSCPDGAIWQGFQALARRGYFVEPTSAIVFPALRQLADRGIVRERETVAAILTGSGLKGTDKIVALSGH